MKTLHIVFASVVAAAIPSLAAAEAPGEQVPAAPMTFAPGTPKTINYSSQLMTVDGLSVAAILAGSKTNSALAGIGGISLFVGAPLVHLSHGETKSAAISFALRVGLPFAGFMIGGMAGPKDGAISCPGNGDGQCQGGRFSLGGAMLGTAVGLGTALIIDYTKLAKHTETQPGSWQPTLAAGPGGFSVGAVGKF
jgi:hypothetical protein